MCATKVKVDTEHLVYRTHIATEMSATIGMCDNQFFVY